MPLKREIEFPSNGLRCRGWVFVPDRGAPAGPAPAIVMAPGFSVVKEMFGLSNYGERFAGAGFVTLLFDFRFLGASDGGPRGRIVSHEQQEDYRNAITWLSLQPEVDPERIGAWGTSYAGGHVLHLAAFDRRIKVAVVQAPTVNPIEQIVHRAGREGLDELRRRLVADRRQRFESGTVNYAKVVGLPGEFAALRAPGAYEAMMREAERAPNWVNQVTLDSLEDYVEYLPTASIERICPTPLLMILAEHDALIPVHLSRAAFERAGEPKELLTLPCGHFDVYEAEPWFSTATNSMVSWLTKHL
jgi:fermentation-respiration switch protein FrsA (DUF1100 family)